MWSDPSWPQAARNTQKCAVCDQETSSLPVPSDFGDAICSSIQCQQVWQKKDHMPPAMFQHHLNFQREVIRGRLAREQQEEAHRAEVDDKIREENLVLFERLVSSHSNLLPEYASPETHLVALPSGKEQLQPLAAERVAEYRAHLENMIIAALVTNDADDLFLKENEEKARKTDEKLVMRPEISAKADQFCALCKGGCCTAGGNDALLDVRGVRRYMQENPELSPIEVLERYLDKVPGQSMEGSCINHTSNGCVLPRDMRSDICNGYFCDSVKSHNRMMEGLPEDQVVAITRNHSNFQKYHAGADLSVREVAILDDQMLKLIPVTNIV
ncbi:hypothetical protein [Hahella ganghwensis]|uniref:hypothetical protein n=1 Tax=Hahella ganghwensis TaxID=286420 RepID=UPI00036F0A53|nr:hypothetical protein [Hahella ganghwensis]